MFVYKAKIHRVIDGDTMEFKVDLGFKLHLYLMVRLLHVNTYELRSSDVRERRLAKLEKKHAELLLDSSPFVILRTKKTGKYGRWLGEIELSNGESFNKLMGEYHRTIANYD